MHWTAETTGHVVVEQLPVVVARVARPYTGASLADAIDVRRERAAARFPGFCGLATCLGASTTTLGSEVVVPPEGVAVCAIAVPPGPHNGATARPATKKGNKNFTVIPPMPYDGKCQPSTMTIVACAHERSSASEPSYCHLESSRRASNPPPSRLASVSVPRSALASCWAMARPRPVPPVSRLREASTR